MLSLKELMTSVLLTRTNVMVMLQRSELKLAQLTVLLSPADSSEHSCYNSSTSKGRKASAKAKKQKSLDSPYSNSSPSKKKKQNKLKNFPDLIFQNMKTKVLGKDADYLRMTDIHQGEQSEFEAYLQGYNKQWKTWEAIKKFVKSDPYYGAKALEIICNFLRPEHQYLFDDWLAHGRMYEENKELIRVKKCHFIDNYETHFRDICQEVGGQNFSLQKKVRC